MLKKKQKKKNIWTISVENGTPQLLSEPTVKQKTEHLHAHIVLK